MPISSAPELELSLISFAGLGSSATRKGGDKRKRRWREGWGLAIILDNSLTLLPCMLTGKTTKINLQNRPK